MKLGSKEKQLISIALGAVTAIAIEGIIGNSAFNFFSWIFQNAKHDPTFLALLIAIFSITLSSFASLLLYRKQRNTKEVSWSIIFDTTVVDVTAELNNDVQILFQNRPVSNVRLLILKIWNEGNIPILRTDYKEPISFSFGKEGKILSAEIVSTKPVLLNIPFRMNAEKVFIGPLLLNSKDTITFKVLITGNDIEVNANAKIEELNQISFKKAKSISWAL